MVMLWVIGLGLIPPEYEWQEQLLLSDRYAVIGENGEREIPPEYFESQVKIDQMGADELAEATGESYDSAYRYLAEYLVSHDRMKSGVSEPTTFSLRLKADQKWGSATPSSPLGPSYGSTERAMLTKGNWRGGAILDRDRYEPNWGDLRRYWFEFANENSGIVVGDYTVRVGEGATLWESPAYYSGVGVAGEGRVSRPRIRPATNTQVNSAIRGVICFYRWDSWDLLLGGGSTYLDASVGSDGKRLGLSDGGLHRTTGESAKKNSLREDMVFASVQRNFAIQDEQANLGLIGWKGRYSQKLQPVVSLNDPFPMQGASQGAFGLVGGLKNHAHEISVENSWDANGITAQRGRITLINQTSKRLNSVLRSGGEDLEISVRLAAFRYPVRFNNPHARTASGKEAKNLQGLGIATELRKTGIFRAINFSCGIEERLWRTQTDETPPIYSYGTIETEFLLTSWVSTVRLSRRNGDEPEAVVYGASLASSRPTVTRIRFSTYKVPEKYSGTPRLINYWWEVAKSSGVMQDVAMAAAVGYRNTFGLLSRSWTYGAGVELFRTPPGLPVYSSDVAPPDIFATVRLAERGARLWGELKLNESENGALLLRISRLIPFRVGARANGSLYLVFNRTWGGKV